MGEWPTRPLSGVARLFSGGTPSKTNPTYWDGNISWLTPKDMNAFCGKTSDCVTENAIGNGTRLAPSGSIFITVRGMSLHKEIRILKIDRKICFNQDIKAIVPRNGTDARFLYFALSSKREELLQAVEAAGHGTGRLPTDKLESIAIPHISEKKQRAIAAILGSLDDKIDLNRRTNETLEAMARAIFKDWFVDFGPTRAKMEGRTPYLAQEVWDFFPNAVDDEEKPLGWRMGTLANISKLNPESWSERNAPERVKYVDLSNTKWGTIESVFVYEWADAPSRARRVLRPGDTIVGTVRPGNGSYAFVNRPGLTGSTGFAVLRPKTPQQKSIIYCAVTSPKNIERLTHLADGGAYPAVRPETVAATELILSTSHIYLAFSSLVDPLLKRVELNKEENATLAQVRDLLLPKLMSGEIRVKDAEKAVGDVL